MVLSTSCSYFSNLFLFLFYSISWITYFLFYFISFFWLTACVQSLFPHVWLFATPWTVAHQALLSWDSPDKNTETGCHAILQWIFYYYCFVILGVSSEGHIYVHILMPYTQETSYIYIHIYGKMSIKTYKIIMDTGILGLFCFVIALHRSVFFKLKICGNSASSKAIGTTFPTTFW